MEGRSLSRKYPKNILQKKGNNNTTEFSKTNFKQISNKFYLLKIILSNKVKVITGSVIGKVKLLHQGYKVFTQSKILQRIEETNG